jgi:NADPH:quinone reductase-like Zn-dependent oxidoreductase
LSCVTILTQSLSRATWRFYHALLLLISPQRSVRKIVVRKGQAETELVQIPSNISTEEAASIPLGLVTAAIAMYNESGGLELTEPWTTEGKDKYAGKPFVVCAALTSVGQFGACARARMT